MGRNVGEVNIPHGKIIPYFACQDHTCKEQRSPIFWVWSQLSVRKLDHTFHIDERGNDSVVLHLRATIKGIIKLNNFCKRRHLGRFLRTVRPVIIIERCVFQRQRIDLIVLPLLLLTCLHNVSTIDAANALDRCLDIRISHGVLQVDRSSCVSSGVTRWTDPLATTQLILHLTLFIIGMNWCIHELFSGELEILLRRLFL
mmetsp:Transcript_11107/g.17833  ORF Transcript_11107/g.17833 Transcript_11107/m.17833 type:complete len:200 (-) Transcript_11107:1033-1632(-)